MTEVFGRREGDRVRAREAPLAGPSLTAWVTACVIAEGIGMSAAAGAARGAEVIAGPTPSGTAAAWALAVVVAGGLVEGLALGLLQGRVLRGWLVTFRHVRWVVVTVLVAGLGWAIASAPSVLSGDEAGPEPSRALVLLGAAGIGIVMGLALGGAQALVLRGAVARPGRWVAASALGWTPAMVVIFAGATTPQPGWSTVAVVVTGTVTGVGAGALLGLITGAFLPSLTSPPGRGADQ